MVVGVGERVGERKGVWRGPGGSLRGGAANKRVGVAGPPVRGGRVGGGGWWCTVGGRTQRRGVGGGGIMPGANARYLSLVESGRDAAVGMGRQVGGRPGLRRERGHHRRAPDGRRLVWGELSVARQRAEEHEAKLLYGVAPLVWAFHGHVPEPHRVEVAREAGSEHARVERRAIVGGGGGGRGHCGSHGWTGGGVPTSERRLVRSVCSLLVVAEETLKTQRAQFTSTALVLKLRSTCTT